MTMRTAVIPAAGLGTRFLPATKAVPKGLLPIVDTPAIQLVVEEALAAGLEDVIVVLGPGQDALREHFAPDPALEQELEARAKAGALEAVRRATRPEVRFVVQEEALGLGHAVSVAAPLVGGAPFAVLLGDDLLDPTVPLLRSMLAESERTGASVIAAMHVGPREIAMYGCITPGETDGDLVSVSSIVEKPDPAEAASDLAVVGRYVFTPGIVDALATTAPGAGGEIQLTDAIGALAATERVYAYPFERGRYDAGNPLDALEAQIAFALARDDLGSPLRARLTDLLASG
ncbi:MAG TPA: UTP--glucose-1-phosphate uridylyltransferase [Actinomycetota bacterium]|jgi:UTP--glucose-1-phosphate uridylyltransferase|nr:UTP--glucose-1-phosphate uridylyltransferase [Actinomycetota bacterium]